MDNRFWKTIMIMLVTGAAFTVTCELFDSPFAENSIDWFSFAAGMFLAVDGIYKLKRGGGTALTKASRLFRVGIGACIFSVHLVQYLLGTNARVFDPLATRLTIDWGALMFGSFLVAESGTSLLRSPETSAPYQMSRLLRLATGTSVMTIHLLQFMRF